MSKQATKQVYQFHVTRQLGFKPILYCWCGASIDTNKNGWQALRKFKLAHENICEMPAEEAEEQEWDAIVSKPHVRDSLRHMATEASKQISWPMKPTCL